MSVKIKFNNLDGIANSKQKALKEAVVTSTNEMTPNKEGQKKRIGWQYEILEMMKKDGASFLAAIAV